MAFEGGACVGDALHLARAAGSHALTIGATTFSGFETVNLNEAGTAGTFQLAGDTSASPDAATGFDAAAVHAKAVGDAQALRALGQTLAQRFPSSKESLWLERQSFHE